MNNSEYNKIIELSYRGGGFLPENDAAFELAQNCSIGEVIPFHEVSKRDISFHRCYFALLSYIYGLMPQKFQKTIPRNKFYYFLKHLKGEYNVIFEFKDGTKLLEYDSIAFGRMSQVTFESYVKEQLPFIYSNVIGKYYKDEQYELLIASIETEFSKFLDNLR